MTHRAHPKDQDFDSLLHAYWQIPASHKPPLSRQDVGLLYCCQQVYAEAMPVLYAENVFEFIHPQDFVLFSRSMPPNHLSRIKSVHVSYHMTRSFKSVRNPTLFARHWVEQRQARHWRIPQLEIGPDYDLELRTWWEQMLPLLAYSMPGLEHLKIRVLMRPWFQQFVLNGEIDALLKLLDGMKVLRGLRTLELDVGLGDESILRPSQRLCIEQLERKIEEIRRASTHRR